MRFASCFMYEILLHLTPTTRSCSEELCLDLSHNWMKGRPNITGFEKQEVIFVEYRYSRGSRIVMTDKPRIGIGRTSPKLYQWNRPSHLVHCKVMGVPYLTAGQCRGRAPRLCLLPLSWTKVPCHWPIFDLKIKRRGGGRKVWKDEKIKIWIWKIMSLRC